MTTSVHQGSGTSEAAAVTIVSSGNYECCVEARLSSKLLSLAEFSSTECTSINVRQVGVVGGSSGQSTDLTTVIYALAGMVGLLLLVTIVLTVGCVCVLSRRKYQVTHPRYALNCM